MQELCKHEMSSLQDYDTKLFVSKEHMRLESVCSVKHIAILVTKSGSVMDHKSAFAWRNNVLETIRWRRVHYESRGVCFVERPIACPRPRYSVKCQ